MRSRGQEAKGEAREGRKAGEELIFDDQMGGVWGWGGK